MKFKLIVINHSLFTVVSQFIHSSAAETDMIQQGRIGPIV